MTKKDPAESDKPDYLTGYMMCKDILPELSKRINLGAHKYEPDDWKKRDAKYFWQKLHRHMRDAATDWNSIDEDGLPHLTAMWFHITALVWKRQDEQTVSQAEWYKPHPGFHGEDEEQTLANPFEEWLAGEGLSLKNGRICDSKTRIILPSEDEDQVRKEYDEYVRANKTKEPAEDDEVLCPTFEEWCEKNDFEHYPHHSDYDYLRYNKCYWSEDVRNMYLGYLAEQQSAKDRTEANKPVSTDLAKDI